MKMPSWDLLFYHEMSTFHIVQRTDWGIFPWIFWVTISTFISKTFCPWVAKFHLRPAYGVLSHSSYNMPGLTKMYSSYEVFVLRVARLTYKPIGKDISRNVCNLPLGISMVNMKFSSNNMKSPCPNDTCLHKLFFAHSGFFVIAMRWILCLTLTNLNIMTS